MRCCCVAGQPDPQSPRASQPNALHAPDGFLHLIEYAARLGQELGAGRRQPDKPMPFSGKQADTNLFIQHGYLLRDRRLCDVEPVGGAMEIQLLSYGNEIVEMAQLNLSVPNIISPREVASRLRLGCKSRICHLRLHLSTSERKAAVGGECVIPLDRVLAQRAVRGRDISGGNSDFPLN